MSTDCVHPFLYRGNLQWNCGRRRSANRKIRSSGASSVSPLFQATAIITGFPSSAAADEASCSGGDSFDPFEKDPSGRHGCCWRSARARAWLLGSTETRKTSQGMWRHEQVRHSLRCCVCDAPQRLQASPRRRRGPDYDLPRAHRGDRICGTCAWLCGSRAYRYLCSANLLRASTWRHHLLPPCAAPAPLIGDAVPEHQLQWPGMWAHLPSSTRHLLQCSNLRAHLPVLHTTPAPVIKHVAVEPAVTKTAPAPVREYVAPSLPVLSCSTQLQ